MEFWLWTVSCGFAIIEGYKYQGPGEETSYREHQQDLLNVCVWGRKKIPRGCLAAADPPGRCMLWIMLVMLEIEIDSGARHVGSVGVRWRVKAQAIHHRLPEVKSAAVSAPGEPRACLYLCWSHLRESWFSLWFFRCFHDCNLPHLALSGRICILLGVPHSAFQYILMRLISGLSQN